MSSLLLVPAWEGPWNGKLPRRLRTTAPLRAGTDHVDVQVPAECEVLESGEPAPLFDQETRVIHLPFALGQTGALAVSFKCAIVFRRRERVRGPASLTLPLPRPLRVNDGGAHIDVTVPDDVELLPTAESEIKEAHKLSWQAPQCPEQIAVAVQPFRPEIHVFSVIDVTLHGSTAQVKQELHLRFPAHRSETIDIAGARRRRGGNTPS